MPSKKATKTIKTTTKTSPKKKSSSIKKITITKVVKQSSVHKLSENIQHILKIELQDYIYAHQTSLI